MYYSPIVKLKSDKITLKRLCACVTHATKRNHPILYKKILTMSLKNFKVHVSTTAGTDIINITPDIERIASQARDGAVLLFVPGSTAALTTIEYESGAVADLRAALERCAPRDMSYAHDRRWGDGNGYAHVRAALLGPSLAIPLADGKLLLGTWQQVVVCDFDNRPRTRDSIVQLHLSP
jgi:secondary thiamine-phosphate synthase enzyme